MCTTAFQIVQEKKRRERKIKYGNRYPVRSMIEGYMEIICSGLVKVAKNSPIWRYGNLKKYS